jgi:hypothetical protein
MTTQSPGHCKHGYINMPCGLCREEEDAALRDLMARDEGKKHQSKQDGWKAGWDAAASMFSGILTSGLTDKIEQAVHDMVYDHFNKASDEIKTMPSIRDLRQQKVVDWGIDAFGKDHMTSVEQRGLRMVEEAIEAAQAAGCDPAALHHLILYVYSKPVGDLRQEVGGTQVCLMALANAAGFSADQAEQQEIERVISQPAEHWAARNRVKNEAGFVAGAWQGEKK